MGKSARWPLLVVQCIDFPARNCVTVEAKAQPSSPNA